MVIRSINLVFVLSEVSEVAKGGGGASKDCGEFSGEGLGRVGVDHPTVSDVLHIHFLSADLEFIKGRCSLLLRERSDQETVCSRRCRLPF